MRLLIGTGLWDVFFFVCYIPSPLRVGTLLLEVPGTPNGASIHIFSYDFFEFELKTTGKDIADPTQYVFQHKMV